MPQFPWKTELMSVVLGSAFVSLAWFLLSWGSRLSQCNPQCQQLPMPLLSLGYGYAVLGALAWVGAEQCLVALERGT